MTGDLDHIFPGVGMGGAKNGCYDFVEDVFSVENGAEMRRMRGYFPQIRTPGKHAGDDLHRIRSAEPHQSDRPYPCRGGESGYRIVESISDHSLFMFRVMRYRSPPFFFLVSLVNPFCLPYFRPLPLPCPSVYPRQMLGI